MHARPKRPEVVVATPAATAAVDPCVELLTTLSTAVPMVIDALIQVKQDAILDALNKPQRSRHNLVCSAIHRLVDHVCTSPTPENVWIRETFRGVPKAFEELCADSTLSNQQHDEMCEVFATLVQHFVTEVTEQKLSKHYRLIFFAFDFRRSWRHDLKLSERASKLTRVLWELDTGHNVLIQDARAPPSRRDAPMLPTPDDFINVDPLNDSEFSLGNRVPKSDPGKQIDNYDAHADLQYQLMREDFMIAFRLGVTAAQYELCHGREALANDNLRSHRMKVFCYNNVSFQRTRLDDKTGGITFSFQAIAPEVQNWTSRLKHGNLVLLARYDGTRTRLTQGFYCGVIVKLDKMKPGSHKKSAIGNDLFDVSFFDDASITTQALNVTLNANAEAAATAIPTATTTRKPADTSELLSFFQRSQRFVVVESKAFFVPVHRVMRALKESTEKSVEYVKDGLLKGKLTVPDMYQGGSLSLRRVIATANDAGDVLLLGGIPQQLESDAKRLAVPWSIEEETRTRVPMEHVVDSTQLSALARSFSSNIAVIKGTPGTGKTFIGVKIAQLLVSNGFLDRSPMLILTLTQHALDSVAKDLLKFASSKSIVRMGAPSKDPEILMARLGLSVKLRDQGKPNPHFSPARRALEEATKHHVDRQIERSHLVNFLQRLEGVSTSDGLSRLTVSFAQQSTFRTALRSFSAKGSWPEVFKKMLDEEEKRTEIIHSQRNRLSQELEDNDSQIKELRREVDAMLAAVTKNEAAQQERAKWEAIHLHCSRGFTAAVLPASASDEALAQCDTIELLERHEISVRESIYAAAFSLSGAQRRSLDGVLKKTRLSAAQPSGSSTQSEDQQALVARHRQEIADRLSRLQPALQAQLAQVERELESSVFSKWLLAASGSLDASSRLSTSEPSDETPSSRADVDTCNNSDVSDTDDRDDEERYDALNDVLTGETNESTQLDLDDGIHFSTGQFPSLEDTTEWLSSNHPRGGGGDTKTSRLRALKYCILRAIHDNTKAIGQALARFDEKSRRLERVRHTEAVGMFKAHKFILGTTAAAMQMLPVLKEVDVRLIMVEEVGEVPEAHILACLTPSVRQLILIGDDHQLSPKLTTQALDRNGLDASLMKRLCSIQCESVTLTSQRRMHPDISEFVKPYYARVERVTIEDHPSTQSRAQVSCIRPGTRYWWIDTTAIGSESTQESTLSAENIPEARYVLAVAQYLLVSDAAKPDQLAILTAYKGQLLALKKLRREYEVPESLRIDTIDNYQGEEADIVLISLVRTKATGFLNRENRGCVALSRARRLLCIFGNTSLFEKSAAPIWRQAVKRCRVTDRLGAEFPAWCTAHDQPLVLKPGDDNDWGCPVPCGAALPCGHVCRRKCHVADDPTHKHSTCTEVIDGNIPPCGNPSHRRSIECGKAKTGCSAGCDRKRECGHPCLRKCHADSCDVTGAPPCTKLVPRLPPCGNEKHSYPAPCYRKALPPCLKTCSEVLQCHHKCGLPCHPGTPHQEKCEEATSIRPCGHVAVSPFVCYKGGGPCPDCAKLDAMAFIELGDGSAVGVEEEENTAPEDFVQYLRSVVVRDFATEIPCLPRIIDDSISIAKERSSIIGDTLTFDQLLATVMYTFDLEETPRHQQFYSQLNSALRRRTPKRDSLKGYLFHLHAALAALPPEEGEFYRGLDACASTFINENYQSGTMITWNGVTSVSTSLEVARSFAGASLGVILKVRSKKARNITELSALPRENERILIPGTKLMVTNVSSEGGTTTIVLQESSGEATD